MMHIIKWQIQPEHRSRNWLITIENARIEIEEILEEEPHLKPSLNYGINVLMRRFVLLKRKPASNPLLANCLKKTCFKPSILWIKKLFGLRNQVF